MNTLKTYASIVKTWPECLPPPPAPLENSQVVEPQEVDTPELPTSLRIFNLSDEATEHDLRRLFKPFGYIKRIKVVRDQFTNKSRGFGFITFATHEQAQKALRYMDRRPYGYQILQINWSTPRKH